MSTVYNRYHYVSDIVAGVIVGLAVFWWGKRVYGGYDAAPDEEKSADAETR